MSQPIASLGKMTAFYVPSHKLDAPGPSETASPRGRIHDFLMCNFKAYTHSPSPVKGFWQSDRGQLVHDVLERFEVSFGSEQEFERLIEFLRRLCRQLDEQSVYLTRGEESFLVSRAD